ncbi:TRAP transporter small permease subunit [Nitratireductor kimnyeongensis]|uniref:TRAP transporter small permease protein n=1 Tax=Nitratireductor kimnyeongensis TaxID=430679 RepID=A0ABW0T7U8_9HYPH|nr:TRAP transporter small permease subunit [Nitratireductor kimnyeongensis]QZZ36343.1 TRAP transporter small permease subunit [Nitratireductor kimnyeongensis]
MAGLLGLSRLIDAVNQFIGKQVSWLILVAVLVSAYNAIIRFLGNGLPAYLPIPRASNSLLELQWYLYGTVFMLASAYTLQRNEHIRIDIISSLFSKRTRDWIDLFCHVFFLLPFVSLIVWLSWPWFRRSFLSGEISANASGLIIWPAKFMVLAGFVLLTAQAISEIVKRYAVLRGLIDEPTPQHEIHPAAEAAIEMEEKRDD